jgi:hypothetical protein
MSRATTRSLLAVILLLASGSLAFGQAGSTGGVIGKTDKSVSGGAQVKPSAEKPQRALPQPAPPQPAKSKVFENPTIDGIRVDGCMKWGPVDCGAPAANHWCQSKGFGRATEWDTERVHPTIFQDPQSSVKVCDYFFCGAFTHVVCE